MGARCCCIWRWGNKESYANWLDFIRDLVRRGLNTPVMITTDGADGLIRAVTEVFARSLRQRCLAHKVRNVMAKVPLHAQAEVKAMVQAAYYAPDQAIAEQMAADVLRRFHKEYPSAMRSFRDDAPPEVARPACIAYMRCPQTHHKRIRTTNLIERSFLEERRRTKVIPRFFTEESCLKLAFASLWQASQRWQGVTMTDFELEQIALLRQELGIEDQETRRTNAQVAYLTPPLFTEVLGLDPLTGGKARPTILSSSKRHVRQLHQLVRRIA